MTSTRLVILKVGVVAGYSPTSATGPKDNSGGSRNVPPLAVSRGGLSVTLHAPAPMLCIYYGCMDAMYTTFHSLGIFICFTRLGTYG